MTSRWSVLLALVAVAGIALAGAATIESSPSVLPGPAVVAEASSASDATAADPYLEGTPLSTEAPEPVVPCQNYAWQCTYDGGPCGPLNACHCLFHPGFGWVCGR